MDQNSILSVTQHQPPLPKLYKENIQLDPRYDLCQEKVKYKFFEKGIHNNPECNICKISFSVNDPCRRIAACKHLFHEECIKKYIKQNDMRCPICNQIIDLTTVINQKLQNSIGSFKDGDSHDRQNTQEDFTEYCFSPQKPNELNNSFHHCTINTSITYLKVDKDN